MVAGLQKNLKTQITGTKLDPRTSAMEAWNAGVGIVRYGRCDVQAVHPTGNPCRRGKQGSLLKNWCLFVSTSPHRRDNSIVWDVGVASGFLKHRCFKSLSRREGWHVSAFCCPLFWETTVIMIIKHIPLSIAKSRRLLVSVSILDFFPTNK